MTDTGAGERRIKKRKTAEREVIEVKVTIAKGNGRKNTGVQNILTRIEKDLGNITLVIQGTRQKNNGMRGSPVAIDTGDDHC
mmetsp:Transcript_1662/g.3588  ORF Transcript_1662/g.3588 Transcript_1662/m.3588 type:complete len:82 (+) Transcript_1662:384-629(+)